ncbi:MAG: DUF6541 family protein, partial [Microbacteriaceae bacterium]
MGLSYGVLIALLLMVCPGAMVARAARLSWPVAVTVGPALTYGVVALAIMPFGALGIRWNGWSALCALAVAVGAAAGLRVAVDRFTHPEPQTHNWRTGIDGPVLVVAAGVALGAALIGLAALRGIGDWQSIPSNWDSVWHANTIRWILDTGQASPTHMGELRNIETHADLYYPSAFHALAAVYSQLTGAAATTAYTVGALTAAIWLLPVSAAALTWRLLTPGTTPWRAAAAAGTAAALSASFTAVPYVEFDVAAMPNLVAFGLAAPVFVLITSAVAHRDRIPVAVVALVGVFSVHLTGGIVVVLFVAAWWLLEAMRRPVLGRRTDFVSLLGIAVPAVLLLLPQFLCVLGQADIIAGHAYSDQLGRKRALFAAVVQHTRHLNDYPIQNILIALAAAGAVLLAIRRIWWPLAVLLVLIAAIVHSDAPFGGPLGFVTGMFGDLFYSDPRRLSAVVTLLYTPMAGIALAALVLAVTGSRWVIAAVLLVSAALGLAWHYFPRHRYLFGEKYDNVMVAEKDLEAFAHLAALPGARDTVIGNANTDGTAWMYAVAGLHPLWTHYDYPVQQGPGYNRFVFWVYADDADTDPRVAEAVRALNIRYVMTSTPVVRGFVMPDGLVSLDNSRSWTKIYDNGESRIYEWRGDPPEQMRRQDSN